MDLFTTTIQPDELVLYKGTRSPVDVTREGITWFGLDEPSAARYGPRITRLRIGRPLRLLNISSWLFQYHFMDQLNLKYPDDTDLRSKDLAVLPLGIPNYGFQKFLFDKHNTYKPDPFQFTNQAHSMHVVHANAYLMGHRFSEQTLDHHMVTQMRGIYGSTFDGYIQRTPVSSLWLDRFQPEVCLFEPQTCQLSVVDVAVNGGGRARKVRTASRQSTKVEIRGGGRVPNPDGDPRDETPEDMVRTNAELRSELLRAGYTDDEIRLDQWGRVISPSFSDRLTHAQRAGLLYAPPREFPSDPPSSAAAGGGSENKKASRRRRTVKPKA